MISLTSPVKTRAHSWSAGWKLAALCVVTMLLFQAKALEIQLAALAIVLVLYAIPGMAFFRFGLRQLRFLWLFIVIIMLWHLFTNTALEGATISLRLISAVAFANLVTMTTQLSSMIDVLTWLATPLRRMGLQTRPLELAIALVIRFTPVLIQKGHGLADAWRARSGRRPGWHIVVPFAVLAIDDADHIAEALKARGGVWYPKEH